MDLRSDGDLQGIVEEMAEDRGRIASRGNSRRRSAGRTSGPGLVRTLLFAGVAVIVLFITIRLLVGGGDTRGDEVVEILAERLDLIEMRLDRIEETARRLPALTGRMDELTGTVSKLERDRDAITAGIESLNLRLEAAAQRAPLQTPAGPAATRDTSTHTVQRGETLFSIARSYGLSVEELCLLNGIEKTDIIRPGQTLIVGKGG